MSLGSAVVFGSKGLGRTSGAIDGVSLLSLYLLLLVAVPSQFIVPPLGGAGTPALLVGVCCLIWWMFTRTYAVQTAGFAAQPIRACAGVFASAVVLSYIAACLRPINTAELSTGTLSLISVAGWLGVLVLAHDGVDDMARMDRYLGRLTIAGAAMAGFGLFQFVTHQAWTDQISIPGLSVNNALYGAQSREGFTRPSGTAIHPIEFGAVLTMLLPLSVARAATGSGRWLTRGLPPVLMLTAISLSSSRSALVTAAVGSIVLLPALDRRVRGYVAAGFGVLGVAVFVLVPGMLGTLTGLFTGFGQDSSARSRLDSYSIAAAYAQHAGPFGRGLGTFLPRYRIFDNEYLLLFVEVGIVGVLSILLLLASAIVAGMLHGRRLDPALRVGMQGLIGGVASGGVSLALFDAFSFPMVPGLLFLLVGLVGAFRRLTGTPLEL